MGNNLAVNTICVDKLYVQRWAWANNITIFFYFSAALGTIHADLHVLVLAAPNICHKSTVVQCSLFLSSWQWHLSQQHTQNAFLRFHCNNGYITHILPVFVSYLKFMFILSWTLFIVIYQLQLVYTAFIKWFCIRFFGHRFFHIVILGVKAILRLVFSFVIFLLHSPRYTNPKNGLKLQTFIHIICGGPMMAYNTCWISAQVHHTEKLFTDNKQNI